MSSFISRIISMRDADDRRKKPIVSKKDYVLAAPPMLYDDSESDDADDEFEPGDDYLIVSSSDTQSEQDEIEGSKTGSNSLVSDGSSSLNIIKDSFDSPVPQPYRAFHTEVLEISDTEDNDIPVITLNLPNSLGTGTKGVSSTSKDDDVADMEILLALEESMALREGAFLMLQNDTTDEDSNVTDEWEFASADFCDSWAFELEAAEEDLIAQEEEQLALPKLRRSSHQDSILPPQFTPNYRQRGRKVAFALKPNVFGEQSSKPKTGRSILARRHG
ncbi:hypothetical protein PG984_002049 [Apiospora sp. TS-2023a]